MHAAYAIMRALTFTLITDREPMREQMPRYTKMLLLPCAGATRTIKYRMTAVAARQYSRNAAWQRTG